MNLRQLNAKESNGFRTLHLKGHSQMTSYFWLEIDPSSYCWVKNNIFTDPSIGVSQPGVRRTLGIPGETPGDPRDFSEYFCVL